METRKQVRTITCTRADMHDYLLLTGEAFSFPDEAGSNYPERLYENAYARLQLLEAANESDAELERHISMIHRNYISEL